jgi:hypothetical protein
VKNLIASKYNPEKTIINEEHTLEQSHVVQNTSLEEQKVKFNADLNDKQNAKDETEQTFNDYTMAEYSVIGGVKKKKKKKVKRKDNDTSEIKTNTDRLSKSP